MKIPRRIVIKRSDIEQEERICPYCMNEPSRGQWVCCGESSAHFENAYGVKGNSGWILESEVDEIIEDLGVANV